jgi:2-alkyl-3-oxoalkanoate reductase
LKILLTGSTGFLGYRTLERLINLPYVNKIIATGRTLSDERTIVHAKVQYRLGDLRERTFVEDICSDVDVIINTASLSSPWGRRSDFVEANINTQAYLIEAAKSINVKRFIYISSPSIYYNGEDRFLVKEADVMPKQFINQYASSKYEAEMLLAKSGIPFIALRPRAIIGRGDTIIMPRLLRAHQEGKLKIIGNGKNVVDLTSVENVVEAIVLSLEASETAINNAYNITNGEPVNLYATIGYVLDLLGHKLPSKSVPFFIANNFARLLELKSKITDYSEPIFTSYGIGTLAKSFTLDITKARNLLGYKPIKTTEESAKEFVDWYKSLKQKATS